MAMSTTVDVEASTMSCPNPACTRSFACDACLHAHLVRRHDARYADAFGRVDEAFLHFCDDHGGFTASMLGL